MKTTTPFEYLLDEHRALLAHYGRAQLRCTDLLAAQAREIERLQADAMRLRAQVIVRDTALAYEREDRAALAVALPGLPRRRALVRQVEVLAGRIQDLMREVLHWQWRAGRHGAAAGAPLAAAQPAAAAHGAQGIQDMAVRSVLCIAQDASGALVTQRMVDGAHGVAAGEANAADESDHEALEASLVAADLVICQTGCLGHNAYWRVQDHCKRTGKPCVLVDQPQVIHFMRGLSKAGAGVPQEGLAES